MDRKYWFNNKSGSFVINTPNTGKYWYNHLWNEDGYYASVTQTGHGTIRYISEDCKNVILNKNEHRYFYLRDEESKDFWNISIMPSMIPINDYRCEHGLEFTRISAEYKGIKSSWFITVPEKGTYEVWKITMNNTTSQRRVLSAFSSIHFDLSGFEQPYNYKPQTTSETIFLDKVNAVFNWSKSPYQPHERCSGFIASSETVVNYDGWLDKFHGVPGNESRPDILINGKNCTNSNVTVRERCGILQNIIELLPGETKIIYYIVGFGCSPETAAKEINDAFNIAEHICKIAIERGLKRYGNLRVTTPDRHINNIMNFWVQKQISYCMIGKKAVRDNAQIAMGLLNFDSLLAKKTVIECLCHQYNDGHAMLTWSPLIDKNIYSDPPMWIILAVCEFIKETGDFVFLDEIFPYYDIGEGTVLQHLQQAERWLTENTGTHGLPLIRYADWNDALNIPDENAESVFMAMAIACALKELAYLAEYINDTNYANILLKKHKDLVDTINETSWNGDYYVRAFSKYGVIGDKNCTEGGNIYINPQSWAILGDVIPNQYMDNLFKSIDGMETEYGIPLCKPAYKKYYFPVGRMSGMLPGVYENGGIYHHACGFKIMADCKAGRRQQALNSLKKMIPDAENTSCSITTTEPYVFTNCYLMHSSSVFNVVSFSWQTGTSAWALRGLYEGILGLKRTYSGLEIVPVISKEWNHVTVRRIFRNCIYILEYENFGGNKVSIMIDGEKINSSILPIFNDGKEHYVSIKII